MTDEFKDVQDALSKFRTNVKEKIVTGAARSSANVIADEAKARVHVRTGLLKKSIGVAKAKKKDTAPGHVKFYVVAKSKVQGTKKVTIGGQSGKMKFKVYAWYAHMVEFGTVNMAAIPFMRPAYETKGTESVRVFQDEVFKRIEK
ncbi:HK97-gp10 family putative phage morphogenesis protein [Sulfurovum mangrovi]|uniref:HK97-gp10 family putative phage morphogenesis protein n=1 Tax=Sulfurovum mangrovi TaxID=2893889 RepID=UPI001E375458|nr:HK97-gp10 family putative phage morphogenesis protein [Sulfurovum mangrovi]UFH59834.1 HK97 gp10 family phage protein [Sulfurovum mangrovi]UFH59885.1 HK97 gp10 family phage protein [Sulfurovum mangrovi]